MILILISYLDQTLNFWLQFNLICVVTIVIPGLPVSINPRVAKNCNYKLLAILYTICDFISYTSNPMATMYVHTSYIIVIYQCVYIWNIS